MKTLAAAGMVAIYYLGARAFALKDEPFMKYGVVNAQIDWRYAIRAIQVGATLFNLRKQPGFSEMCRRINTRDLESAYCELKAADMFYSKGFEIYARAEIGVRRSDFDFLAATNDGKVNVEVTSFRRERYSPNTLRNALNDKRKQLPSDLPSAVVCFIPQSWECNETDLDEQMRAETRKFLKTTGRINYVVFISEIWTDFGSGGHVLLSYFSCENPDARIKADFLSFLLPKEHGPRSITVDKILFSDHRNEFALWLEGIIDGT